MNLPLIISSNRNTNDVKTSLAKRLAQFFSSPFVIPADESSKLVFRIEEPVSDCSPLQWLRWQNHSIKIYWSNRERDFESAGISLADKIMVDSEQDYNGALTKIKARLSNCSGKARYYGGIRFNIKTATDKHWLPYGSCLFILPQFELFSDATGSYLACNIIIEPGQQLSLKLEGILESLARIVMSHVACSEIEQINDFNREDIPQRNDWFAGVYSVLDDLRSGKAEKIVLGRSTLLSFDKPLKPLLVMEKLKALEPVAYHFYIQSQENSAFIGATPERLYRRYSDFIQSEAVAGTCPRGKTVEEDRQLAKSLLQSEKNYHEHVCVLNHLKSLLERYCNSLQVEEVKLLRQARVQHLYSYIEGQLAEAITDGELLKMLHPTPAVGGLPRDVALRSIERLEPFDRGWYAGPIGWIGNDRAEFAVAIRSGLINGKTLRLFAGAGVVEGSLPHLEWAEMEAKISVFMSALGIE